MKCQNIRSVLFLTLFFSMIMFWVNPHDSIPNDNHSQMLMQNVEALTKDNEDQDNIVCYGPLVQGYCLCLNSIRCTKDCN